MSIEINTENLAKQMTALLRGQGYSNLQLREVVSDAKSLLSSQGSIGHKNMAPVLPRISSAQASVIVNSLISAGLSEEAADSTLSRIQVYTYEDMGSYLKKLLDHHRVSPYRIGEDTGGLDDGYIREIIRAENSISKPYLFAISLYLGLDMDEIREFMSVDGMAFDHSIPDEVFQAFIDNGNYDLDEYVRQCKVIAEQAGVKLPDFFYNENWAL